MKSSDARRVPGGSTLVRFLRTWREREGGDKEALVKANGRAVVGLLHRK